MKLSKHDFSSIAKRLEELERTGLVIDSFRHNDLVVNVSRISDQMGDGVAYFVTSTESLRDATTSI